MKPVYLLFLSAVLPIAAQTQLLSFGALGGAPAQTPLGQAGNQIVFGPTVDIRIAPRLSIETGLLFYRMGENASTTVIPYPENAQSVASTTERARALEVPVLAKYHFRGEAKTWRPFATLGPAVRRTTVDYGYSATILSGTNQIPIGPQAGGYILSGTNQTTLAQPGVSANRVNWNIDPSVGAGVDFKAGRFHLEPQMRYSYSTAGASLPVRKNQIDSLLGFRF